MTSLIDEALFFAQNAHWGQERKYTGKPYINHPKRVGKTVALFTDDENVIIAAFLHDVVEDCEVSLVEIENIFGKKVSTLVEELTNPSKKFPKLNRAKRKELDRNHIGGASSEAQLIKVVDRIDNLKEMTDAPGDFKKLYAKESLALADVLTKAPKELVNNLRKLVNELL